MSKLVLIPIRNKGTLIFLLVKSILEHYVFWLFRIISLVAAITVLSYPCTHEQTMTKRTQPKFKFPEVIIQQIYYPITCVLINVLINLFIYLFKYFNSRHIFNS